MTTRAIRRVKFAWAFVAVLSFLVAGGLPALGDAPKAQPAAAVPKAFDKDAPEDLQDLLAIQGHVRKVLAKVIPCTVGLQIGPSAGSGVIIDKEGHVLTAGHVFGAAGKDVVIILHDGRRLKGKTLGHNRDRDSGLIQITDKGPFPFTEMGKSAPLKAGQWCLGLGHPGGYRPGRTPVARLGRILDNGKVFMRTDCVIVGGDSGGPLFDMEGKVIAIHSRISGPLTANMHVPVDTYRDTFARLVKSEVWGGPAAVAYMGIQLDPEAKMCRIREVSPGSPADKAALKVDDVLISFDGKKVASIDDLGTLLRAKRPGNEVAVQIQRGEETIKLRIVLGKRPI